MTRELVCHRRHDDRSARRAVGLTVAAVTVGGTVVAAALVLAALSLRADARPQYAVKELKNCGYCHVDPEGGGERNDVGKRYEANGLSFDTKK